MQDAHFKDIVGKADNLPIVGMIFIFGYFTWFAMKKAVENDERIAAGQPTWEKTESEEKVLVFPYLIYIEFVIALLYAAALVYWAILVQAPLEDPANPTLSPNPSKAPWYFLGLQEMLVYFDPWLAGVLFPTVIIVGLCAIPYIDNDPKTSGYYCFKQRRWAITAFMFGFWILWLVLIMVGTFLRGPNWNFFGPFEVWTAHKVVPLINVNLSEFFYIKWLGIALPQNWFIRELPGFAALFIYFILIPKALERTVFKKLYERIGAARYHILIALTFMMIALPLKMYFRWAFNLKYIIAIPEFFFNI
ncbi:MAG: cytochrome C [Candidatus Omnitrophica bacterium]|nr:cytochrome C [Candidatus Omnitrophota bacterium]